MKHAKKIREVCQGNYHPDTEAKLFEISSQISRSRRGSRAPSLGSPSQYGDGAAPSEIILPDDTEAEVLKTTSSKKMKYIETEDELERRKKWHHHRFVENAKVKVMNIPILFSYLNSICNL